MQKTPVVQEGKHVQNEKALDSIHIGQEEAMVQRTKTFRTERCCIPHGPSIPHGSKKLKRRKGVWQAVRDDSKDSDEGDRRRPVRAKEEDRMPWMTMKTLRRFIATNEILMTATVTARAVGNVEGPDDSSPTDFMTFHEFLWDGSYFMSSYYILMSSISRNPITFDDEFHFTSSISRNPITFDDGFHFTSSISRNPITFDEFLFDEFHFT